VIGRVVDSRLGYEGAAYGAQAAAAQAQAAQAEAELSRIRFLRQNGVYAQARLDQAEAAARAARAGVAAARAQQSAVNAVAGQGAIIAPSSGRVLMAPIPPGSAVGPGTSVATITSGAMILRLELPETLMGQVRVGSAVIATGLAVEGSPAARATVSRVYPAVTGGQMMADVDMPGLGSTMVGRRVTARVATGDRQAIVVPRRFVETRYGIDYVSIISRTGVVTSVPVQIAPSDEVDRVEILAGVKAGDVLMATAPAAVAARTAGR
jgi:RND family efflux transporter MFP subunit